jgi:catechol 2,3-dioxygenase-like lactoylglutathione lyase family enzyme
MSLSRVHVILYVRDQNASTSFYRSVLAFEPTLNVPGMTEFELSDGLVLGLMPEAGVVRLLGQAHDPAKAHGVPRAELYVLVDNPAAYHARSIAAGGTEVSPIAPRDWGHEAGYSLDLDRHVVAFARALPTPEGG